MKRKISIGILTLILILVSTIAFWIWGIGNSVTIISTKKTVFGVMGKNGGKIGNNNFSLSLSKGVFQVPMKVEIKSLDVNELNGLPEDQRVLEDIYAAISESVEELLFHEVITEPSVNYAHIVVPLKKKLSQGTELLVMEPVEFMDDWRATGEKAIVNPDGMTATFRVATDGQFILMKESDLDKYR